MGCEHIEGDIDVPYHTDRFWRPVARVMPDYEERIRWLNENGVDLDL